MGAAGQRGGVQEPQGRVVSLRPQSHGRVQRPVRPYSVAHAECNAAEASKRKLDDRHVEAPKDPAAPWFAVASFTNPHDIDSYPTLPRAVYNSHVEGAPYTLAVPPRGATANQPTAGTMGLLLNRLGFPQNNANVSPTWDESLDNKPSCQLDYAYKMGLTLMSMAGWRIATSDENLTSKRDQLERAIELTLRSNVLGLPLTLTANPTAGRWGRSVVQGLRMALVLHPHSSAF